MTTSLPPSSSLALSIPPAHLPFPPRMHALCPLIPVPSFFFFSFFFSLFFFLSFPLSLSAFLLEAGSPSHLPLALPGFSLSLSLFLFLSLGQHRGSFQDARFALAPARRTRAFRCLTTAAFRLVLVPTNTESRTILVQWPVSLPTRSIDRCRALVPWIFRRIESRCRFWEPYGLATCTMEKE